MKPYWLKELNPLFFQLFNVKIFFYFMCITACLLLNYLIKSFKTKQHTQKNCLKYTETNKITLIPLNYPLLLLPKKG